ncbi:MAG: hypothetical protein EBU90_00040 [Proteobacteria bacterium]|nr:hypothetical protein [Pseudomonadota bacterium]NBP12821.1 hypothetical protein [bacterium]
MSTITVDPFTDTLTSLERLKEEYKKHKSLVIALDYDNTIFDYHNKGYTFTRVINLIKECNELGFKIVIFSGSAKERYDEMYAYCEKIGIKITAINEDVINWRPDDTKDWTNSKIYYNIFLDDRAGLGEAALILKLLVDSIKQNQ